VASGSLRAFVREGNEFLEGVAITLGPPQRTGYTRRGPPPLGGCLFEGLTIGQTYEVFIEDAQRPRSLPVPAATGVHSAQTDECLLQLCPLERREGWRHFEALPPQRITVSDAEPITVCFERRPLPRLSLAAYQERILRFAAQRERAAERAVAQLPILRPLADCLRASPLTINLRAAGLRHFQPPQLLNAFEIEQAQGRLASNISEPEWYDLRLWAEHYWFGFPYHRAQTSRKHAATAVREWWAGSQLARHLDEPDRLPQHSAYAVEPQLRPRYAALDYRDSQRGATPDDYYGYSFLRLRAVDLAPLMTCTLGDTWELAAAPHPDDELYTFSSLELLLLAALQARPPEPKLIAHLLRRCGLAPDELPPALRHPLHAHYAAADYARGDRYVEVQLHSALPLAAVEAVCIARSEQSSRDLARLRAELDPAGLLAAAEWILLPD
jgi:hypothetical protein